MSTPERQAEINRIMRELLQDNYTHLHVSRAKIIEDLDNQKTQVSCEVNDASSGEKYTLEGEGVGVIDAFFHAMVQHFANAYPSLKTISFSSFTVQARLDTKKDFAGTDSMGEVTLQVANSEGKLFRFSHASRSVTATAIIVTLLSLEYFINSEKAFVATYNAIKDARDRNRADLVQQFTNTLTLLVQNTSYSEVIDNIKREWGRF